MGLYKYIFFIITDEDFVSRNVWNLALYECNKRILLINYIRSFFKKALIF